MRQRKGNMVWRMMYGCIVGMVRMVCIVCMVRNPQKPDTARNPLLRKNPRSGLTPLVLTYLALALLLQSLQLLRDILSSGAKST